MSALLPPALLLFWSGVAATLLAGLVLAPLLGEPVGAIAPTARPASAAGGIATGIFLLPLAYGAVFALAHEANLILGALLGLLHAGTVAVANFRLAGADQVREAGNRLLLCVCYGVLLGFTYVTP